MREVPSRPEVDESALLRRRLAFLIHTAVTVSMHKVNGSQVRYLESDFAYSFHSCPNRSCAPAM